MSLTADTVTEERTEVSSPIKHWINQVPNRRLYLHHCYVSACIAGLQKRPIENHHKAHVRILTPTHHDPHPVFTLHCTIFMHAHYSYHNLAKISDCDKGESPVAALGGGLLLISVCNPCQLAVANVVASRGTSGNICDLLLPGATVGSINPLTHLDAGSQSCSQHSLLPSLLVFCSCRPSPQRETGSCIITPGLGGGGCGANCCKDWWNMGKNTYWCYKWQLSGTKQTLGCLQRLVATRYPAVPKV